jgi:uncharacterized phage protein (TIGR01671 family)
MVEFEPLFFTISDDSLMHPTIFTDTTEHFYGEDPVESARDAVLMQYVGIKDLNGVEIYEGDILARPPAGETTYDNLASR